MNRVTTSKLSTNQSKLPLSESTVLQFKELTLVIIQALRGTHSHACFYLYDNTFLYCLSVCVFQMVILDVLIIGGGPHALTLASSLSNPDPDPSSDPGHDLPLSASCSAPWRPQPILEPSNNKRCSHNKKKRRKAATGTA